MERAAIKREYQDIIMASNQETLPEIDVVERVMGRINGLGDRRSSFLQGIMRNTTVLGSLIGLILMVSVTAYAASEYIQIRNTAGTVKVQYIPATNEAAGSATAYHKYAKLAQAFAKPGELIAYYVKDNKASKKEAVLQFEYKEQRIRSYSDFEKEIKRTGAPKLPEVANGYAFDYGKVFPSIPSTDAEKGKAFYRDNLRELTARANKDASGEKMFMKAVPWSEPATVSGIYTKGKAHIGIYATLMHGGDMYVEQEQENKTDKIRVAGTEVVYNSVKKQSVSYEYLNWYNEEQDAYYTLTSYGDKSLSKEQFLKLAKELIEQK
ncbi:hypothetical protein D7Z26_22315 [Cohnella endophytica]|uniref:DUF4367 domain-containing protein n=1 Tax=Cohnella endophytica TaxID=2419778 RepID=A0A494XB13_9BACL|nr:hypothetical protein [Cohnella endophytica]RKP47945.1 hypothetical protein D7Z26_22315 [Cohnella endophytica]